VPLHFALRTFVAQEGTAMLQAHQMRPPMTETGSHVAAILTAAFVAKSDKPLTEKEIVGAYRKIRLGLEKVEEHRGGGTGEKNDPPKQSGRK
jgi:hypothetical protein